MNVIEDPICQFTITIKAAEACPLKRGITGGTIFIIILFVLIMIYLVTGILYNRFKQNQTGLALIPNLSFWLLICGLFINGCKFAWSFFRNCGQGTSSSPKAYESSGILVKLKMVLPTLHSQYATKHLATPQQIMQRKQEIEAEKKAQWAQTANYFKAQTRHNSVHSHWTSPTSAVISHEANRVQQEKEEKLNHLEQRRNRLAAILEAEKNKFQNELASIRQSSRESVPDMKVRAESLRSAREKERQAVANEKLYEHWVTNDPDLRSIEQQKLENLQPEYWSEQLNERRLAQEEEEEFNFKYQQELRQRLDEQEKLEQEEQNERKKRIEQLKMILQQQMDELKEKEEESEMLKQEEERLLREQWELDQYEEERKQMEKRYIQQDYGRQLLRQHKAKLHKRAKEIQEQLVC
ncbi:unnamed protein product [Rotaria sp. Silwood2]|nr:unnamed protein product [Rotaria sp. Silwood2]